MIRALNPDLTMTPRRKPSAAVKAAAERAARRSAGEEVYDDGRPEGLDPAIAEGAIGDRDDPDPVAVARREALAAATAPKVHVAGGGRASEFKPEYTEIATQMCVRGATVQDVADEIGVARYTVCRWMARHPEFGDAIRASSRRRSQIVH